MVLLYTKARISEVAFFSIQHSRRNVDALRRRKAQLEAQVDIRMMADKKEKYQYSELVCVSFRDRE